MFEIASQCRAWIVVNPVTSSAAFSIVGFIMGLLASSGPSPRASIPALKEGFLVVTPTAKLFDAPSDLKLKGSKVLVVHRESAESLPCKAAHRPLLFSANERVTILSGNLEEIDSLITSINMDDLKNLDIANPKDQALPSCQSKIKIIYGEGDPL